MKAFLVFILPFLFLSCDTSLALVRASAQGDLNSVRALVSDGASLNTPAVVERNRDPDRYLNGQTPLLAAACTEKIKVIEFLIERGADVNVKHGYYQVPLLSKVIQECFNPSIIRMLLRAGGNPNQADRLGRTPLFYALNTRSGKEIVAIKLLVEAGVMTSATQDEILTTYCHVLKSEADGKNALALTLAARLQMPEKKLCQTRGGYWRPVLYVTAESRQTHLLNFLLSRMTEPERKSALQCNDEFANSLMNMAAEMGDVELIGLLYKYGADVNQKCHFELFGAPMVRIPIRMAIFNNQVEATKLLIELGANISSSGARSHLLADLAETENIEDLDKRLAIMKLLLKNGAHIDERDEDGLTPLMRAAKVGHSQMARFLLANKANFKLEDQNGWTPMMHAEAKNHVEFIRALRDAGAKK